MIATMILLLSHLLALLCLVLTLLPLSSSEVWWVRAADFPRLQVAVVAGIALFGIAFAGDLTGLRDGLMAAALIIAIVWQLTLILPYTVIWPMALENAAGDPGPGSLRLMVANVLMDNRETEKLFAMIEHHRPDVLLAVETDRWWCDRLEEATSDYAHKLSHPLDNTYGMYLASRLELVEPEIRFLLKENIPSIRTGIRLESGEAITFYALHPEPPSPTEAETALPRDAELVMVAKEIADHGESTIVAGDLNDVAWSHTSRLFRRLGHMLDARIGRGLFSTFHAGWWPLRWPLDHVFASDDFLLHDIERLDAFGSDHFPIVVTLGLAPKEAKGQSAPVPDDGDADMADDKLARSEAERTAPTEACFPSSTSPEPFFPSNQAAR